MTTLTQISETQAQKATTANENFDAVAPAGLFGRKALTTVALTWGYYGGIMYIDGVATSIADGTLSLTANQTNYIEATRAGVVSANITGFTSGRIPLYTAVAGAATISSYADQREISETFRRSFAYVNMSGSPSTVTLSATQARCDSLELQYASGGAVLIVPSVAGRWFIYNNSGQTVTVQTAAGGSPTPATVTLVDGSTSLVFCDGTNVRTANIYDSAAVAITGGTINGTAIGGTTPAAGAFTTLSATGALNISGAGAGQISFPATQNASAGANVLDDYEEGTWTPTDASGATLTLATATGTYTKIGNQCFGTFRVIYPVTADGSNSLWGGLPFTVSNDFSNQVVYGGWPGVFMEASFGLIVFGTYSTNVYIVQGSSQARLTNANLSAKECRGSFVFRV